MYTIFYIFYIYIRIVLRSKIIRSGSPLILLDYSVLGIMQQTIIHAKIVPVVYILLHYFRNTSKVLMSTQSIFFLVCEWYHKEAIFFSAVDQLLLGVPHLMCLIRDYLYYILYITIHNLIINNIYK